MLTKKLGASVLIIGGMHRSGTTLTARWLQACGLHIGHRLLVSKYAHANPEGNHFEDLDFLEFHKSVLRDNGIAKEGLVTTQVVDVSPIRKHQAHELIVARDNLMQWGWKEPRTCLFLSLWKELLPEAKLLVVYRPYAQVADSLLRRKLDHPWVTHRAFYRFRYMPLKKHVQQYLAVWDRYNRDLLSCVESKPESAIVLHLNDITSHSDAIARYLITAWNFQLEPILSSQVFFKDQLKKHTHYVDAPMLARLKDTLDQVYETYQALEHWREVSLERVRQQGNLAS